MSTGIAYPDDLPCCSRVDGHTQTIDAGLVRTPMGAGNARQRRAHKSLAHRITLTFVMAQGDYADWLTWMHENGYSHFFNLDLPGLLAGRQDSGTALVPVRLCSNITAELIPIHRLWYWRARVEAEWMPTAAERAAWGWFVAPAWNESTTRWLVAGTPAVPSTPDWVLSGTPEAPSAPLA